LLTALGVGSGVISSIVLENYSFPFEVRESSPGLTFGAIFALYLIVTRRASPLKGLGMIIAFTASWRISFELAFELLHPIGTLVQHVPSGIQDLLGFFMIGSIAGFVKSGLLVLSLIALFGFFRTSRLRAITVAVGSLTAGGLVQLMQELDTWLVLWPFWYGAFAYCFSLALIEADERGG
jgi:hypothetical protein